MAKMPTTDEWVEKIGNKAINEFVYEGRTLKEWIDLMASGKSVILPNNATNGDVIKAVFPNISKYNNMLLENHSTNILFDDEWWNSPYKAGDIDDN